MDEKSEPQAGPELSLRRRFMAELQARLRLRFILLAIVFVILAVGGIAAAAWKPVAAHDWLAVPARQFAVGLLVAAVAAVVIPLFLPTKGLQDVLFSFLQDDVRKELEGLGTKIGDQTRELYDAVKSLSALQELNIARVYHSRADADLDIVEDLQGAHSIRVLGISLNDLMHASAPLHDTWNLIQAHLGTSAVEIKFLLVHPDSLGAQLRDEGEPAGAGPSTLRVDVESALERIRAARGEDAAQDKAQVRLYHVAPQLFLVQTDTLSYAQPYHFWSKRDSSTSLPLVRCAGGDLHESLRKHFDILWKCASIPADDYLDGHAVGIDEGLSRTGIVNVFAFPLKAGWRMTREIDRVTAAAKAGGPPGRLWLQGHSLDSYFDPSNVVPLFGAVKRAIEEGTDVRVLVLHPYCEQAYYRSYREFLLSPGGGMLDFEAYRKSDEHEKSALVRDTTQTIQTVRGLNKVGHTNVEVRLYSTAPICFMLLTSNLAMIEQYHYGKHPEKSHDERGQYILGKDMPVLEYWPKITGPRAWRTKEPQQFEILKNHFEFVWDQALPADQADLTATGSRVFATSPAS